MGLHFESISGKLYSLIIAGVIIGVIMLTGATTYGGNTNKDLMFSKDYAGYLKAIFSLVIILHHLSLQHIFEGYVGQIFRSIGFIIVAVFF